MDIADTGNIKVAKKYLGALQRFATGNELAEFFTADVVQEEFPNALLTVGARRNLAGILEASERGREALTAQTYELLHSVAQGDGVVLEVQWTGTLKRPLGSTPAGGKLRARFAVCLQFRDGKISQQRNYDCFEPW